MASRVTSSDVAREAGLSRATVSYVLNNDPKQTIPEATRQRVLDAASRLGYRPFGPARLLRGARSNVVLFASPTIHSIDPVESRVVEQLSAELRTHGLQLLWQLGESAEAVASELAPCMILAEDSVGSSTLQELSSRMDIPLLPAFPGYRQFVAAGATAQVEHFAATGHTRLAYAAPGDKALASSSRIRWREVVRSSKTLRLPPPRKVTIPDDSAAAGRILSELLEERDAPTALAAYNDMVAATVLGAAHDLGLEVPGSLAVMGIDNLPIAAHLRPSLTSVVGDTADFSRAMADFIAATVQGETPTPVTLPRSARVVSRSSA